MTRPTTDSSGGFGLPVGTRVLKRDRCRRGTVMPHAPEYSRGSFPVAFDDGIWEILDTSYVTVLELPKGGRR
ncbi:MAG: hypothetical protein ACRDSZ_22150 [Pseudonocardiaceae bacterium]